jgi:hypothetical protein
VPSSGEAHRCQGISKSPAAMAEWQSDNGGEAALRLGECEGGESANVRQGRAEGVCGVFT